MEHQQFTNQMRFMRMLNPMKSIASRWLGMFVLLMVMLPQQMLADDMKDSKYYTMTTSADHWSFKILLTDLYANNTWANDGGYIRAYSGPDRTGTCYTLARVYTENGSDGNEYWKIHAQNCMEGGKCFLTNAQNGETALTNDVADYYVYKGGSSNRTYAEIDCYFSAKLIREPIWYLYYEYIHSGGSTYQMYIGKAEDRQKSLGYVESAGFLDIHGYTYERSSANTIKFTVPQLPDGVPAKVKDTRIREGIIDVDFTYQLYDGSKVTQKETLQCETTGKKTYDITIPSNVGNFASLDLSVAVTDRLRDAGGEYFWDPVYRYNHSNVFATVPVPTYLKTEFRPFESSMDLTWNAFGGSTTYAYIKESEPYVYRLETDKNGNAASGKSWEKRANLSAIGNSWTLSYSDKNVDANTYYKYMVVNVPKEWIDNRSISTSDLNSPPDDLLKRLGHCESAVISTQPSVDIYNFTQDQTVTDKVKLTWQYSRIPVSQSTVDFEIWRRQTGNSEWIKSGTVTADANPAAGSVSSYNDNTLPNSRTSYDYKVVLTINNGKNQFESDIITAGLLSGTTVTKIEATKGTHENTVRISWKVKQLGTDNTNFELYRRYAGVGGDFMKVYSTSGTSDSYTYEDNTVQPGYYYEYKVEAYSGNKSDYDDNTYQNSLSDVGFCQARGVISGRITFGTGTAVEDVRVSLQPSDTGESDAVQSHSQRVNGASTGIAWDADETEIAKVFGSDKDFTFQMFVRPDLNLSEGGVIGSIPGLGQLLIGPQQGETYKVYLRKSVGTKYTQAVHFRPVYYFKSGTGKATTTIDGHTVYAFGGQTDVRPQLESEGYTYIAALTPDWVSQYWSSVDDVRMAFYYKIVDIATPVVAKSESVYDLGLTIPAGIYSMLSVENNNGNYKITIGDDTSSQMTQLSSTSSFDVPAPYIMIDGSTLYNPIDACELVTSEDFISEDLLRATITDEFFRFVPSEWMGKTEKETEDNSVFAVGGATGVTEDKAFKGNFTEVRVWDHMLTDKEKTNNADRILNGRETGLALYWPMDEGVERLVFDASYTNDLPNGRHATVGNNISVSSIVPTDNQLSRYAVTNDNGEYILRGIPFVGSGSTYTVLPTKGIHVFSPTSRNGFIGNGSLALNNFDFTDQSSFPVKGKITYLNTNIPVDSVQFMIDGSLVQSKEGVRSDANGEYEISVPIGEHLIECYKNGHKFTSFPLDGSKYDFKKAETVNFVDSTLVNVTGRINGGFSDQYAPLGFNQSVNRLGKATIKLSLGRESQCSFNYIVDDHGDGTFGTTDIPVESATANIKSSAYRAGGDHDDTYYIYITTDEDNGEFSAMLPPLSYKVESIKFTGGTDYDNEAVFKQNLPLIDATNTVKEKLKTDSALVDGNYEKYTYSAKMIRQYRAVPEITVKQKDTKNGAFGDMKVAVSTLQNEIDTLQVLDYTDTGYSYKYGYPIFVQNKTYDFDIDIAENYKNLDTQKAFKEIPSDAVVNIINDASVLSSVTTQKETIDGKEYEAGMSVESFRINVQPDSTGHVGYSFMGGWPNLAEGHLRNMSVSVTVDGRTTMWVAPDSRTEALDLILLGCLPSGTNFVTNGPDKVDYILRRPPGSTSVASFENTTIVAHNKSTVTVTDRSNGDGVYVSLSPTWKIAQGMGILGPILMADSKFEFIAKETYMKTQGSRDEEYYTDNVSYTLTEKTATPNSMPFSLKHNEYRPENGDTYVGHATNLTYSKARKLGLYQQSDGSYLLTEKDGIAMSESFETNFVYTQEYIEDYLIPHWKEIISDRLIHVDGNHWDENNPQVKKVPGEIRYYTSYSPGDEEFGLNNGDSKFDDVRKARNGWPSYRMVNGMNEAADADEVENASNQILAWESTMASNEADKLKAFDDNSLLAGNYSISGGTSYSQTAKNDTLKTVTNGLKHTTYKSINSETKFGFLVNDAGANGIVNISHYDSEVTDTVTLRTRSKTVAWTMSDADTRSALSVDVYKSPQGWGPIFRTRAGQTVNPYEGETRTEYYKKGDESEKLNEATMRVELPQLRVDGSAEITDVPTGGKAEFKLQLSNQSETNDICTYVLQAVENSNPNGAVLTIDGNILSNGKDGRSIKMKGGETVEKMLIVTQSDRSITDYNDIELVLKSEKDISVKSDPVKLRVHFVPSSAHVDLSLDHTVLNKQDKDMSGGVIATMFNIDRQDEGLRGLRLRYRRKGTDAWNVIKQWTVIDALLDQGYDKMPDGSHFTQAVTFAEDGTYELQAQTFGNYGTEEVTYQSEIIEVTQDTHGPKILGMVSPEDGLLTYVNRNNMHLRFNEVLNGNALSKSDNFRIEGGMNNVVAGGAYPDVAVQLNDDRIETEAMYDLSNSDYAFDMWFYRQGDGSIISLGTDDNLLSLSTHDGGKLRARVGSEDDVFETNTTLPAEKWTYMALDYKRKTTDDPHNRITMLYVTADDAQPVYIGQNMPAQDLSGHGKLSVGGDGMQGMISGLSVWNSDVTAAELYKSRNQVRAAYTPGLVGYWEMNEGHGTVVEDRARSRHLYMDSDSWYINNENRAVHLDSDTLLIDIATFNPSKTDNFAYEMWFRGTEADNPGEAALLSVKNGTTETREVTDSVPRFYMAMEYWHYYYDTTTTETGTTIGFDEGRLKLKVVEDKTTVSMKPQGTSTEEQSLVVSDITLSDNNYLDGNWHHFALNVRRGTSAIAYIDGQAVKVLPEASVPGISGRYLLVGGELTEGGKGTNLFTGDVDEIRIWNASLDGELIKERMYERMDNSYPGLVGYFPMEEIHRTVQGNVVTDFATGNFGESGSQIAIANPTALAQSTNAPALKPGSTKMRLDDTQFDFTASDDEIYFSFPDSSLPLMDNNDFVATVSYIKDEHGNNSETVQWQFHADFASVKWLSPLLSPTNIEKKWDETYTWREDIYNVAGTAQNYEISGLPSWMSVSKTVGTVEGTIETLTFSIDKTVPVGRYTEYIYLTDRLGIRRVLQVNVTVKGDEPDWNVNPDLYESNMMLTGQLYIKDKISEYTDSKIAAFDAMGNCRGVGSPEYVATRDAYYVNMIVYGASATEISTGEADLTFKMYDASTGTTYPIVNITLPGKEPSTTMRYAQDAIYGSYDAPVIFSSTDLLQQSISLPMGWSWMSIYVEPSSTAVTDVLPKGKTDRKKFMNIKSHDAIATVKQADATVVGSLKEILPGNMYKVQVSSRVDYDLVGSYINVREREATIYSGWNWIGTLASSVMSVKDAFAGLDPEAGDIVKSRTAFATYRGDGVWEGTLQSIVPGMGYIYHSRAAGDKTFRYPLLTSGNQSRRKAQTADYVEQPTRTAHYEAADPHLFPDNMNVIAIVRKGGTEQQTAEIGAFVGGECRGAAEYDGGYYFLTIMGSAADDIDSEVEIHVNLQGEEYVAARLPFSSDALYGSLDSPYILDLDATGIRTVDLTDGDEDTEWYTLQGIKIGRKPTQQGIYIHRGKKVTVKNHRTQ